MIAEQCVGNKQDSAMAHAAEIAQLLGSHGTCVIYAGTERVSQASESII